MSLVDKLDEIIELHNKWFDELQNLKICGISFDKYVSRFNVDIDRALYLKIKEQEKINKKYNSEIAELYKDINKNLDDNNKLENPFN